jgi:SAF domain
VTNIDRSAGGSAGVGSPVPRRLGRPRWLDPRVIGGVLLVVAAIVIGSRVIAASSRTTPVWAAQHDLASGTVLVAGDLRAVDVNLGDAGPQYLASSVDPVGRTVNTRVRPGELLPASVLGEPTAGRVVVIPVAAAKFPPGVTHGSVIDLYLTVDGKNGEPPQTGPLRTALTVQTVTSPAAGDLSGAGSNEFQVSVLVDQPTADLLVRSLPTGDPVIALVTG